ncbi:hypothetical protein PFISCL1PPCAC_11947, partial [Pristionchus fissidentatus]
LFSILPFLSYVGAATDNEGEKETLSSDWCFSVKMEDFENCPAAEARNNEELMRKFSDKMDKTDNDSMLPMIEYLFKVFQVRFNQTIYTYIQEELDANILKEKELLEARKRDDPSFERSLKCKDK